ncbi:hypothetical protein HWV62_28415 [Athelia sp. TMB]|nr:hypothetical protein HWV62_28415 [Athelia sp. TMB]
MSGPTNKNKAKVKVKAPRSSRTSGGRGATPAPQVGDASAGAMHQSMASPIPSHMSVPQGSSTPSSIPHPAQNAPAAVQQPNPPAAVQQPNPPAPVQQPNPPAPVQQPNLPNPPTLVQRPILPQSDLTPIFPNTVPDRISYKPRERARVINQLIYEAHPKDYLRGTYSVTPKGTPAENQFQTATALVQAEFRHFQASADARHRHILSTIGSLMDTIQDEHERDLYRMGESMRSTLSNMYHHYAANVGYFVSGSAPGAGPSGAGPPAAGPPAAGSSGAGPPAAGPSGAGPPAAGSSGAGPPAAGPSGAGPPAAGSSGAGPPAAGSSGAGPPAAGSSRVGPPAAGSSSADPPTAGPSNAGPPTAGPSSAGSAAAFNSAHQPPFGLPSESSGSNVYYRIQTRYNEDPWGNHKDRSSSGSRHPAPPAQTFPPPSQAPAPAMYHEMSPAVAVPMTINPMLLPGAPSAMEAWAGTAHQLLLIPTRAQLTIFRHGSTSTDTLPVLRSMKTMA